MNEIDKEFLSFLKRNDCYCEYKENFINSGYYFNFRELMNIEPRKSYISMAFHWSSTLQGFNYWSGMHIKWKEYLDIINETEN